MKSPGVVASGNASRLSPCRDKLIISLSICRKTFALAGTTEEAPMVNLQKVSDADFSELLRQSGKLASYGKSNHSAQLPAEATVCNKSLTVRAHKGVLFGTVPKKKSWRNQQSSKYSPSRSASRGSSDSAGQSRPRKRGRL